MRDNWKESLRDVARFLPAACRRASVIDASCEIIDAMTMEMGTVSLTSAQVACLLAAVSCRAGHSNDATTTAIEEALAADLVERAAVLARQTPAVIEALLRPGIAHGLLCQIAADLRAAVVREAEHG
jgi:hypothetical protein